MQKTKWKIFRIEDITKKFAEAARAVEFESSGGGKKLVKKTKEHLEADKNLKGRTGGTDERNLRAERAGEVVLWMPHHFTGNGFEERWEKGQELG